MQTLIFTVILYKKSETKKSILWFFEHWQPEKMVGLENRYEKNVKAHKKRYDH